MIKRLTFPGAWYADALPLPGGEFAALFPHDVVFDADYNLIVRAHGKMETHLGAFDLPDADEPLYLRITNVGRFEIGGQAHYSLSTWIWTPDTWWTQREPACGVSPVIYDRLGVIHISDCSIGTQGWRYVVDNGTPPGLLVTGDNTYGPLFALNEFTQLGDGLIIGQGNPDAGAPDVGALVWDGAHHRMLEPGFCRFIRATREDDRLAVAIWKQGYGAVLFWLTVADLRALPIVVKQWPAPAPVPVPAPPAPSPIPPSPPRPAPPKEPPMPQTPSLDAWINQELPQLIAAFRGNSSNAAAMADDPHAPHAEWGSFQAYRRYVEGWTFPQMLHHEQTQGASQPSPSEPP